MDSLEIFPGTGIGHLRFGMTLAEVVKIIGRAPNSYFEEDGDFSSELWGYPNKNMTLVFRHSEGSRLTSIEIGPASGGTLSGESLFPRDRAGAASLLRKNLKGDISWAAEESIEPLEQTFVRVPQLGCVLYFNRDGMLEDAQWGPLLDTEGNFVWPDGDQP